MANNINTIIALYIGDGESASWIKRTIDSISKQGYTVRRIYVSGTRIEIEPFLKKVVKESLDSKSLEILESLKLEAPEFLKITEASIVSDDPSKKRYSYEAPHLTKSLNGVLKSPLSSYLTDELNTEITQIFVSANDGSINLYSGSLGNTPVGKIEDIYKAAETWYNEKKAAEEEAAKWQKIENESEKVTVEDLRHIANFITDHFKRKADKFLPTSDSKKTIGNMVLSMSRYKIVESRILQFKLEEKKIEFPTKGAAIELTLSCTGTMDQTQAEGVFNKIVNTFNNKSFDVGNHTVKYAFNLPSQPNIKLSSDQKSATMELPVNVTIVRNLHGKDLASYEAYTRLGQGEKPDFASGTPQSTNNTTSVRKPAGGTGNAVTKALSKTAELGAQAATSVVKTAVKAPGAIVKGAVKGVKKALNAGPSAKKLGL